MYTKTAVITGASSKIMDELISKLIAAGYQIIAVSRKEKPEGTRANVKWIVCDLAKPNQDFSFLKGIDLLFHAAAVSNSYSPKNYYLNNYQSTVNLTNGAKLYGVSKIIYISSILAAYTYGDYGISKIKSEEYISNNFDNYLIIRPSQLYGYSKHKPIDSLIETIKKNRIVFCPLGDKKGIYPLLYTDLVNEIFKYSVTINKTGRIHSVIGPKAYSYRNMIKVIAQTLNRKVIIVPIPKFFIMFVYHTIKTLRIKIGIYPDQIFRFYNCNDSATCETENLITLPDYINNNH